VFNQVVTSEEELRELYRQPSAGAVRKQLDRLDANCSAFIAHSPLLFLGTADGAGGCDVSPKGGPPGFVQVLSDTALAIPDLSGNNRLDSMRNLLSSPAVGMLFIIPGLDETLRVNGRGLLVRDPSVLDRCVVAGRRPPMVIGVEVAEAYIHCGKSFRRAGAWDAAQWPDRSDMPTIACMVRDHVRFDGVTAEQVEASLERDYQTMWQ
jgi:PPOX class probable FMN-dependent enzyme